MVRPQFHPAALFLNFILVTHPIPNQRRPGLTSALGTTTARLTHSANVVLLAI